ncbi:S8 family peptidase [Bacillus sp. T33-2]|uniref:S8 family peptidase n=1 Tax=Bacillus sp. T33-2 TaxID=2054168 RepID=UPI000C75FBE4|nr:S8 family peptidase [Bacillus sp. T33-2]PLR95267.1 peptidase S8 [Bacillus sp. T33-2]
MGKNRAYLLAGVLVILVIAASSLLFKEEDAGEDWESGATVQSGEQIARLQNNSGNLVNMSVNNIQNGENIKNRLNQNPEIKAIYHNKRDASHYYDHEAAVDFIEEPTSDELDDITNDINGKVVKRLNSTYIFRSESLDTPALLDYFNTRPNVEFAEANFILMQNDIKMPNDVYYREKYQWNLPAIETEKGWNISRGNKRIEIAIVDTGVDLDHPDLKNRLVKGYNVLENNSHPDDDNGHGTHVAGIIASETNNKEGIAGITWFNKIMPIKAMGAEGYGSTFDIARGLFWAVDHGADVINLSLGNYQRSEVLEEAIRYAYKHNVVLVAAAGNDNSSQPTYPASYPEVLSVSALNFDGKRADFSNYGDYIDVAAPGVYIPSTYFKKQYAALSGTSMAAPHVAGLAGLILSANSELSNREVMKIIKNSAIDMGGRGPDNDFGSGLIDVNNSLKSAEDSKSRRQKFRERLRDLFQ